MADLFSAISVIYPIVRDLLSGWNDEDFEIYFRLAYRDSEMELIAATNDRAIALTLAEGIVSRMKQLKNNDNRRSLNE